MYREKCTYSYHRRLLSVVLMLGCLIGSLTISHKNTNAETKANNLPASQPFAADSTNQLSQRALSFEANQGQTDRRVKFLSRGSGYTLFLTPAEAVLSLRQKQDQTPAIVRMKMAGANQNPEVVGEEKMSAKVNYFNGRDRTDWKSNVATYARIKYREVYPGIDMVYYGKQQQLEYDFIVAPNSDPRKIRLNFSGVRSLSIDQAGALVMETAAGEIRQHPPVAYQEFDGRRQPVAATYELKNQHEVGFKLGDYDPAQTLVIDPVIDYSTYLGGSGQDEGNDIVVDANGYIYVTGWTSSVNFPVEQAIKGNLTGTVDAFISVIYPPLGADSLVSSTYWGQPSGFGNTEGRAIAINSDNHVLVTGTTSAQNFPTTPGALQPVYQPFSGSSGFLSKFDLSKGALLYSTYLMGNGSDEPADLAVDTDNNVYISGRTTSTANFPITLSAAYQINNAGSFDGFAMKLGPSGSTYSLRYSTYLGGVNNDCASNIAVDSNQNVYLTGTTQSADQPATPQYEGFPVHNAYQANHSAGDDAFVTKINTRARGSASLAYSTYLGGNGSENAMVQLGGIAFDHTTSSDVYVTGSTNSVNFPLRGEFDNTLSFYEVFVTRIDTSQAGDDSLKFSTFLGDTGNDLGNDIAVDNWGRVFVTGRTESPNFPVVCGSPKGASYDGFVTMLDWGGSPIRFSTHLGGNSIDAINAIAVDALGVAHVTGITHSWDNWNPPMNGFQLAPLGAGDAFVTTITPVKCGS